MARLPTRLVRARRPTRRLVHRRQDPRRCRQAKPAKVHLDLVSTPPRLRMRHRAAMRFLFTRPQGPRTRTFASLLEAREFSTLWRSCCSRLRNVSALWLSCCPRACELPASWQTLRPREYEPILLGPKVLGNRNTKGRRPSLTRDWKNV